MRRCPLLGLAGLLLAATAAVGDPGPGDVYREFLWTGPYVNAGNWQRVTDPDAAHDGAQAFLPNPVNAIELTGLETALRAEINLERWGGHAGTSDKRIRVNGGDWIPVPEPAAIPGAAGSGPDDAVCYQYFDYPTIAVPLDALQEGVNTFELTCGGQVCYDFGWGQWGIYAAIFRLYHPPEASRVDGRVVAPEGSVALGERLPLRVDLHGDTTAVTRVDFIGHYEDFDVDGDGRWTGWQAITRFGQLREHIGTTVTSPHALTWATDAVPDQPELQVAARIVDTTGSMRITEPLTGLRLDRRTRSVQLYRPYDVPGAWQTRAGGRQGNTVFLPHDPATATAATLLMATWSGGHADAIEVNETAVAEKVGRVHDYSLDRLGVPTGLLRHGVNRLSTFAATEHHGIEVLWPGMALKVAYPHAVDPPGAATEDRVIYDDAEDPPGLEASGVTVATTARAHAGARALDLTLERWGWRMGFSLGDGAGFVTGYRALRLAVLPDSVSAGTGWLSLSLGDGTVDLLSEGTGYRVDLGRRSWQVVEIPMEAFALPVPYYDTVELSGSVRGRLLLDDVRLLGEGGTAVTAPGGPARVPEGFALSPAWPNPFNGSVALPLELAAAGHVAVTVHDLAGQRVTTLHRGWLAAGRHRLHWDGRTGAGRPAASGLYFVRVRTDVGTATAKVLRLR